MCGLAGRLGRVNPGFTLPKPEVPLGETIARVTSIIHREGEGVGPHLLHHSQETVGAGGRQVLTEADFIDEVEVGIEDFLWGVTAEYADEEGHDAFHNQRVALGTEQDYFLPPGDGWGGAS